MGYYRAGFTDIVGIDNNENMAKYYPFEFIHGDAIEFIKERGHEFDLIHASPPCQGYSYHTSMRSRTEAKNLIPATRKALRGHRYVIENVTGAWADLEDPILLCGSMVGMPISRHRLFEINPRIMETPEHPACIGLAQQYADERGWLVTDMRVSGSSPRTGTLAKWQEIMGIDWYMPISAMKEAIPPAYTELIGRKLI